MKRSLVASVILAGACVIFGCTPNRFDDVTSYNLVATSHDPAADFAAATTFVMPDTILHIVDPDLDDDITRAYDAQVLDRIRQNFIDRGYSEVPDTTNADLAVLVSATTRTVDYYGYWYYWGWWWGGYYPGWGGGWYPDGTVTYTYHLGSLIWATYDLRRADRTNRIMPLAWMAIADGPLDAGAQGITVGTIYGLIDQGFTQSPYIQSGSGAIAVRRPTK